MKRASYREGIEIIAMNDEPLERDASVMVGMASVMLLAEIFGVTQERVAADVVRFRVKQEKLRLKDDGENLVIGQCAECFALNGHERGCSRSRS